MNRTTIDGREFFLPPPFQRFLEVVKFITHQVFLTSLLTYFVFYFINDTISGFVSDQFNMDILLIILLVSGVLLVALQPFPQIVKPAPGNRRKVQLSWLFFAIVSGIFGGALVWLKTIALGSLSFVLSLLSAALIILLSLILLSEWASSDDQDDA